MTTSRDNLQCRIPKAAKESLARLCRFTERSQAKLIELAIRSEEQSVLLRMTEEERKRYLAGDLTVADISAKCGLSTRSVFGAVAGLG
jgi:AraC-like DNA-binding protein